MKKVKEKKRTKEKPMENKKKKPQKSNLVKFNLIGEKKILHMLRYYISLKAGIIRQFPEDQIPFDVFSAATNLDGLVKLFIDESNLHAQ